MNIAGYLSKTSCALTCRLLGLCVPTYPRKAHLCGEFIQIPIRQTISKIKQLALLFFNRVRKTLFGPKIELPDLLPEIQNLICAHLDARDLANLRAVSRATRANTNCVLRQNCERLAHFVGKCVAQEPTLAIIFPYLTRFSSPDEPFLKIDLFKLRQIDSNLRQALRMIALHWGYCHPPILETILEELGYLRADHSDCEHQFEQIDTHWPYGSLIPELLNRAITGSCVQALRTLISFIPHAKRQGLDGNLSTFLDVGTPRASGGRFDLNVSMMCSLRRDLYSIAENRRFAAFYGPRAAEHLAQISPAFDKTMALSLQSEKKDSEIWELMGCGNARDQFPETAFFLHASMESQTEACFPKLSHYHPTHSQIGDAELARIPPVLWDRHLVCSRNQPSNLSNSEIEHRNQLQRIKSPFHRMQKQPLSNDLRMQKHIHIENQIFASFVEMTLFTANDELRRAHNYRSSRTLTEALHLSLYGYTHHAIALREAVKAFLSKTENGAFPHSKLEMLFTPLRESSWEQLQCGKKSFFPSFLIYQWLLTAVVAKLFDRHFYISSEVICQRDPLPTDDEIEHFITCATEELRKYNLHDFRIEHQYRLLKSTGKLLISASFCSPWSVNSAIHSLIAKHDKEERYFIPVREDGAKGRFSPPASP